MPPTAAPATRPLPRRLTGRHVLLIALAFFGTVIATNAIMIHLALRTFPGVEVASSYRAGRAYPAEIAAARAQAERGWAVTVAVTRTPEGGALLTFEPRDARGERLTDLDVAVKLQRPADGARDRTADLSPRAGAVGVYEARLPEVAAGQWLAVFEASRAGERLYRSRNRVVLR